MSSFRFIIYLFLVSSAFAQTQDSHLQKGVELLHQQQFAAALPLN